VIARIEDKSPADLEMSSLTNMAGCDYVEVSGTELHDHRVVSNEIIRTIAGSLATLYHRRRRIIHSCRE
jgi:hypothetical protein